MSNLPPSAHFPLPNSNTPALNEPTTDTFVIMQRVSYGREYIYIPMMVRGRAVGFKYNSDAAMFLRRLTGGAGQLTWEENLNPDRHGEAANPTAYAIRPVRQFTSVEEALAEYDYAECQAALRRLTPKERTLLKLPDPDPQPVSN